MSTAYRIPWVTALDSDHRLTRQQLRDIGDFCLLHAPFSRRWLRDIDTATCMAAELTGYRVKYHAGTGPRHFWPLVLAGCLTRQFLADISPSMALGEIYPESNIEFDPTVMSSRDPKEFTESLVGVCSKPLAAAVREKFIKEGPEALPVISLAAGLEPDTILALLPHLRATPTMQIRGIPSAPGWFKAMPAAQRVRWLRHPGILCEVFRMVGPDAPCPAVLAGRWVEDAHEALVAAQINDGSRELDSGEYRHPAATERELRLADGNVLSLTPVVRPVDLYFLGERLRICIGSSHYIHQLTEGESVFFTDELAHPTLAVEFTSDGRLVEAVGSDNNSLPPLVSDALSVALRG